MNSLCLQYTVLPFTKTHYLLYLLFYNWDIFSLSTTKGIWNDGRIKYLFLFRKVDVTELINFMTVLWASLIFKRKRTRVQYCLVYMPAWWTLEKYKITLIYQQQYLNVLRCKFNFFLGQKDVHLHFPYSRQLWFLHQEAPSLGQLWVLHQEAPSFGVSQLFLCILSSCD